MVSIVSKELHFDEELKKKIEFICDFCNTKPTIINGYIKNIKRTNLSYIEPIDFLQDKLLPTNKYDDFINELYNEEILDKMM